MKTNFQIIILLIFSTCFYAQKSDTLFIKKENNHKIYIEKNRDSEIYKDISNFKEFNKFENGKIEKIGLNSEWIRIHKYNGNYILYAPCDWCYDTKVRIDNTFLQIRGCELGKYVVKTIKKVKPTEYIIEYEDNFKNEKKSFLTIRKIDSVFNIYEFDFKNDQKMLFINKNQALNFDIINNVCKYEKLEEIKF